MSLAPHVFVFLRPHAIEPASTARARRPRDRDELDRERELERELERVDAVVVVDADAETRDEATHTHILVARQRPERWRVARTPVSPWNKLFRRSPR